MLSSRLSVFALRSPARRGFAALALAACAVSLARAGDGQSYVVPQGDGYGIGECLQTRSECGRIMADSWCEAHGHAHALAYGSSDDVTGSIGSTDRVFQVAAGSIVIRCGD